MNFGSMFVWIPRYAYSINEYKVAKDGEGNTQNITKVAFLKGATNQDKEGKSYSINYNEDEVQVGNPTPAITHPAFTFDGKGLTGIWVAKAEASMSETNSNTIENNNVTNKTIKVVPNLESWRYIQIGNIFENCLNMNKDENVYKLNKTQVNSHMIKNNEWGAVTYLAVSQYGKTPTINSSGSSYIEDGVTKYHSYTAGGDYKTNKAQSTTGNETGIYDMNGGAWEYVAAYYDNGNGNLSYYGKGEYFEGNKLKSEYLKYYDKYEVSQNEKTEMANELWNKDNTFNNIRKSITKDRYDLMKKNKGDAMYEGIKDYSYYGKMVNGSYNWIMDESSTGVKYGLGYYNDDFTLIGNCELPFLVRGGSWGGGTAAGVFASYDYVGVPYYDKRFPSGLGFAVAL